MERVIEREREKKKESDREREKERVRKRERKRVTRPNFMDRPQDAGSVGVLYLG